MRFSVALFSTVMALFVTLAASQSLAGSSNCTVSDLDGYDCKLDVASLRYILHWTVIADSSVSFAMDVETSGWAGLAWSPDGEMLGDAVIGSISNLNGSGTYSLMGESLSLVQPTANFSIQGISIARSGNRTMVQFERSLSDQGSVPWSLTNPISMIYAFAADNSDTLAFHENNRGAFNILLGSTPTSFLEAPSPQPVSADLPNLTTSGNTTLTSTTPNPNVLACTPSSLGYQCSKQLDGDSFVLHYTANGLTLSTAMETGSEGWMAIGWSPDGTMAGSDAVIGNLETSPFIAPYHLGSHSSSSVLPNSNIQLNNTTVEASNGRTIVRFQRIFSDGVFNETASSQLIWAYSSQGSKVLSYHQTTRGSAGSWSILFGETGSVVKTEKDSYRAFVRVHGWLMWTAFGVLMPLGIFSARYAKSITYLWFYTHVALQILAWALVTASSAIGLVKFTSFQDLTGLAIDHSQLGLAVVILIWIQPIVGLLRPRRGKAIRPVWFIVHWVVGTTAVVLAWINIFFGLRLYNDYFSIKVQLWYILFAIQIATIGAIYLYIPRIEALDNGSVVHTQLPTNNEVNGSHLTSNHNRQSHSDETDGLSEQPVLPSGDDGRQNGKNRV